MGIIKLEVNVKNLIIAAVVVGVIALMMKLQSIITVFAVSFFIAYLLDPVIDWFEKRRVPRWASILGIMVLGVGLISLFLLWLIPVITNEVQFLIKNTPQYTASALTFIQESSARLHVQFDIESLKQTLAMKAAGSFNKIFSSISGIISSVSSVVGTIIHLSIIPILVFYFLRDFDSMNEKLFGIIDKNYGSQYRGYFQEFDRILSKYFRGQFLVAMILGVLYTVVLLIVGVKPAVLVGVISGILSVVPYLGFMIGFTSSIVLAALQYSDVWHPIFVVIGFAVVQSIEGNFLTPKIIGKSLGLHPTAVIFSLLAGGSLFGIGGMIIALPVAAFIRVISEQKLK